MATLNAYSLFIGARPKSRTISRADDARIDEITRRHFPKGFSILTVRGRWSRGERISREDARQILVTTRRATVIGRWARELGRSLNQEELLLIKIGPARRLRL